MRRWRGADWEQPEDLGVRTIGERVRSLRRSAGLSQEELAAGRFSKEYVSQIERGKTRPTPETLEWIAGRLDTDREFLEHGVSRADAERLEAALARGRAPPRERALRGRAPRARRGERACGAASPAPTVALRLLRTARRGSAFGPGARARRCRCSRRRPRSRCPAASPTSIAPRSCSSVGVVRYSESRIGEAIVLFGEALVLADGSDAARRSPALGHLPLARALPSPEPRLGRSRGGHRARARARGRERGRASSRRRALPGVARRAAAGSLGARAHVRRASASVCSRSLGDRATVGRLLNNLAGLEHLLGDTQRAIALLDEAFEIFVDLDLPVDAGYVCSSLAEVRLESGEPELSETQARKALDLLGDRVDHLQEVGTAQLTLGPGARGAGQDRGSRAVDRCRRRDVRAGEIGESPQLCLDGAGRRREPARRTTAPRPGSIAERR